MSEICCISVSARRLGEYIVAGMALDQVSVDLDAVAHCGVTGARHYESD